MVAVLLGMNDGRYRQLSEGVYTASPAYSGQCEGPFGGERVHPGSCLTRARGSQPSRTNSIGLSRTGWPQLATDLFDLTRPTFQCDGLWFQVRPGNGADRRCLGNLVEAVRSQTRVFADRRPGLADTSGARGPPHVRTWFLCSLQPRCTRHIHGSGCWHSQVASRFQVARQLNRQAAPAG